jgi:hypothetical protein
MNLFLIREQEIFNTLKQLQECNFVVIGGYAVNAYALPRFSVDCDIVVKDLEELEKIEKVLSGQGYQKENSPNAAQYLGNFVRYEKLLENQFTVSMDILFENVTDRMTGAAFSADWIFQHSEKRSFKGKTISKELWLRIVNIDALLVMKMVSCRATDIRDVFMMLPNAKDNAWLKAEVSLRYNFENRIAKIMDKVKSKQFRDGLAGVYGGIDEKIFEKHLKTVLALQEA